MTADETNRPSQTAAGPGFREFVALMAALMSLNALAIDAMIPALPDIGRALAVPTENQRQLVISVYMIGFGTTQLLYGPLADRFGRRRVLLGSLLLYIGFGLLCALADSFLLLLAARMAQGASAAASRVLVIAIIRDRFEGSAMARAMSLIFMIFLLVPVLAPMFGQLTLLVAPWQWIFAGLAIFGAIVAAWATARLPETLHPEFRRPFSAKAMFAASAETLTNRTSIGYTLAVALMIGGLMSYLNSIQQIVFDTFARPELIGVVFAAVAVPMAVASYLNSRLVAQLGMRRIAHSGIILFTLLAGLHLVFAEFGESIWLFMLMQGLIMSAFGLASSNCGTLAMQPLGHVAGTASSVQGTITTILGATLGIAIGQSYDGTVIPLVGSYFLFGAAALVIVMITERGRLFGTD